MNTDMWLTCKWGHSCPIVLQRGHSVCDGDVSHGPLPLLEGTRTLYPQPGWGSLGHHSGGASRGQCHFWRQQTSHGSPWLCPTRPSEYLGCGAVCPSSWVHNDETSQAKSVNINQTGWPLNQTSFQVWSPCKVILVHSTQSQFLSEKYHSKWNPLATIHQAKINRKPDLTSLITLQLNVKREFGM